MKIHLMIIEINLFLLLSTIYFCDRTYSYKIYRKIKNTFMVDGSSNAHCIIPTFSLFRLQ